MRTVFKQMLGIVAISIGVPVFAADIPLQNLTEQDFKDVVGEFSANFTHTSVSGASSLGKIFGIELGLVGGQTTTEKIDQLAKEVDANADAKKLPHAEILGVVSVPLGFTAEVGVIPTVGDSKFKYSQFSGAVKWTATETVLSLPVSLALKGQITKSKIEFEQTISAANVKYDYENTVSGATLLVSKDFMIVEPYVGVGFLKGSGELTATGSATVFDPSFTASQSASASDSSSMFLIGAEVKLLFFKLGAEYAKLFDTGRYTGKLSFYF